MDVRDDFFERGKAGKGGALNFKPLRMTSPCVPTAARKGQKEEDNRGRRMDEEDAGEEKVHT